MLFVDSREKLHKIQHILDYFDSQDIDWTVTKLWIGDYQFFDNPKLVCEKKANLAEIIGNIGKDHARMKAELERAKTAGVHIVFLICQDKIDNNPITELSDLMLYKPKYGVLSGERLFRVLVAWQHKYGIEIVFCSKRNAGKEIIRILGGRNENEKTAIPNSEKTP